MVPAMPSEDIPPLAPFPELSAAPADGSSVPAAETSLLSAAQRREFAQAADFLTGHVAPREEPEALNAADDFLLGPLTEGPGRGDFDMTMELPGEEPVQKLDFLTVPGDSPGGPVAEGFSLQSLAASLTVPAQQAPPLSAPPPVAIARPRDTGEAPPVPAFPSIAAGGFMLAEARADATDSKADGFFVTLQPTVMEPALLFPPARAQEPVDDFDAPLLFPVPSAEAHARPALEEESDPHDRAMAVLLCGALLIVLGLFLACRVPPLALEADAAAGSGRAAEVVRSGHLRGEMFVSIAAAAACFLLGIGATTLRRWAPPIIHAAGWTVLLTVLGGMAVATASMFQLSANNTPGDAVPGQGTAVFAVAGVFGIALPLLLIAVFQRPGVAKLCLLADKSPRWTDFRTVPALMVFICGALLAAAAFAMSIAQSAFPAFGNLIEGAGAWVGTGIAAAAASGLAAAGRQAGWWLLTCLTAVLTAAIFLTCRQHAWQEIFGLTSAGGPTLTGAVLAAATMLPLLLIALMTRRAFAHQPVS